MRLPSTPVAVATNSPLRRNCWNRIATDLKGWPAKRLAKYSLQPPRTSNPQLAGNSAATSTPRWRNSGTQAPSDPSRGQLRAAQGQHHRPRPQHSSPSGVSKRKAPSSVQPVKRCRMWNCTPRARSRCSQARNSGAAFMSAGNTRPEVPTKVSMPRPCAHSRSAGASKSPQPEARPAHDGAAVAGDEGVERLGMREVQAALAGQQEFAPDRRHGVEHLAPLAQARHALRRPSGRPVRRR